MADPITMAAAAWGVAQTSNLVNTITGIQTHSANARAYDAAARTASEQANEREEQVRREGLQTIGEQVAAQAQSGTGFGQTAKDAIGASETNLSMDALQARYQGAIERTGLENKAAMERYGAKASRIKGAIGYFANNLAFSNAIYGGGMSGFAAAAAYGNDLGS